MSQERIGIIVHGIGVPQRSLDPGEAPYWISEAQFLRLLDRIAALADPGQIRLSFDDGNASDRAIALPALQARGLTADFFVLTGRIGQPGSLSAGDILALQAAGMTVGSHGIAHVNWTILSPEELRRELVESKATLEALTGRPVTTAGIPFGAWNGRVLRALRAAGYRAAYSSDGGRMNPDTFLRPRASVRDDMSDAATAALHAGQLPTAQRLRRAVKLALRPLM